jgi:Acetyltransferase (GNAT) domain
VTVLPEAQGKGVGKLLFKTVTDRADAEARKCYLESSRDEPNTAIYERMGFKKVKEMECNDEGDVCKVCPFVFAMSNSRSDDLAVLHDSGTSLRRYRTELTSTLSPYIRHADTNTTCTSSAP